MAADFDFKTGRGDHYRGSGSRGLIALGIVHLSRVLAFTGGGLVFLNWVPSFIKMVRPHLGF